jgi:hypothetical protein
MSRRIAPALLALALLAGCAGPSKLAEKSQAKLADGEAWAAWNLATRHWTRNPATRRPATLRPPPRGRSRATGRGASTRWPMSIRWPRPEQVLQLRSLPRERAVTYAVVPVPAGWAGEEELPRGSAAPLHYQRGLAAIGSASQAGRFEFSETERFVPGFRNAATWQNARPKRCHASPSAPRAATNDPQFGRDIAGASATRCPHGWPRPRRTTPDRMMATASEQNMTVAQLRAAHPRGCGQARPQGGRRRIVWGAIGPIETNTNLQCSPTWCHAASSRPSTVTRWCAGRTFRSR